jgi:hypothetical protein
LILLSWTGIRRYILNFPFFSGFEGKSIKELLENLSSSLLSVVQIFALLAVFILFLLIIYWLINKKSDVIFPFENLTEDKEYNGQAISDSLVAELQKIKQIHDCTKSVKNRDKEITRISYELIATGLPLETENISNELDKAVTISVGSISIAIGQVLFILKRLFPVSDPGSVIKGSIHKYKSNYTDAVRIVVRREYKEIKVWEVTGSGNVTELVEDLAYKMTKDLCDRCSASNWQSLKY